jgi:hypothetical protein
MKITTCLLLRRKKLTILKIRSNILLIQYSGRRKSKSWHHFILFFQTLQKRNPPFFGYIGDKIAGINPALARDHPGRTQITLQMSTSVKKIVASLK